MAEDRKDICPVCGGTGQINHFQGVSRFLLTAEECPECAGTGYKPDQEKTPPAGLKPDRPVTSILVVDDNPTMRRLIFETLVPLGYQVFIAASGDEALEISRMEKEKIDLLLTDVVMPGMSGRQLIRKLQAERPDLKAILMSGYPADIVGPNSQLEPHLNFIGKPFLQSELIERIRLVLEE